MERSPLLGILGGLGPMSTAYFYEMITEHTKADCDQDHIDIVISSGATTPDRTGFILGNTTDNPAQRMIKDARKLIDFGADVIAIPCNTAHYFYEELQASINVPILNIGQLAVEHVKESGFTKIGLLANIAGFGKFGRYDQIPLAESMKMIDLNCKALVAMTDIALAYMGEGSKILNLDSLSAFQPVPYLNTYASTKAFVLSYSRALGQELKPRGIRVLSVNPGWVRTEFFDHALQTSNDAVTYYNKIYEAGDVIRTALRDLYKRKKDVSIHGMRIRWQVRMVKLLPHSLVMRIWLKQQKH